MLAMTQVFAQEYPYYNPMYQGGYNPMRINSGINSNTPSLDNTKKMDVGVQLGTSIATNFNKGYSFSTFVAPEIRYRLSDRLTVRGGISVSNTDYNNTVMYAPYGYSPYTGNITQGIIYVSGDYILSPKLVLSGSAYKEFSIDHSNPENAFRPGYDGKGVMMNLRFIPSDNMFIEVGAEYYQGNNPYRSGAFRQFRPFHEW